MSVPQSNEEQIKIVAFIERYEQLIRVMKGLSPHERAKHFNMREWGITTDCGTTMCAAGFCGSDQWFRDQNFKLENTGGRRFSIDFGSSHGWDAIRQFFGELNHEHCSAFGGGAHDVFQSPRSVNGVIAAASGRISFLRKHVVGYGFAAFRAASLSALEQTP